MGLPSPGQRTGATPPLLNVSTCARQIAIFLSPEPPAARLPMAVLAVLSARFPGSSAGSLLPSRELRDRISRTCPSCSKLNAYPASEEC